MPKVKELNKNTKKKPNLTLVQPLNHFARKQKTKHPILLIQDNSRLSPSTPAATRQQHI